MFLQNTKVRSCKSKSSISSVKLDCKQINLSYKCNVVPVLVHVLPRFRNVPQYLKSNILVYEQALEINLIYGLFHFEGFVKGSNLLSTDGFNDVDGKHVQWSKHFVAIENPSRT